MSLLLQPLAFMEGLGGPEVLLVIIIVMVLFGGEKLPEFARVAGKLIREFKKASSGVEEEFKRALEEDEVKKTIAPPVPTSPQPAATLPPASPTIDAPASLPLPPPTSPPKMLPTEGGGGDD
jgi:TatA/E family protein of Tat protein translocase